MVSFIKPSAAANMKQYLMPSYGEIMKHALTCKAIGAEVCSSVWCEFVLVKVNMNQLGVILYLNMYVCKFEPIQHVFRQKAFCKESILFHSYTLFYSLQRGQGIFIAINYTHVFSGDPYKPEQYTSGSRQGGERETQAHVLLNSIFVSYASIFDLLSKIAVEQFMFDQYDFTNYKDMHCKKEKAMYKPNIKNIDPSLKQNGLLFTDPEVVRKFETFRNEYVHNGPWDLRSSVYYTAVDGEPADVIIYSPDMVDGHFVTSGSRNKFYSQNNRINAQLPDMIKDATLILMRTVDQISALYKKKTVRKEDPKLTEEYLNAIHDYYKSLV